MPIGGKSPQKETKETKKIGELFKCGMRKPERESGKPKLINSERAIGSTRNRRRNRETREKRLGVWLVTARQEPRPTGRAAVTGGLGRMGLVRASRIFLAADEIRMESVLKCEFF